MRTTIVAAMMSAALATLASFAIAFAQRPAPTARASSDPAVAQLRAIKRVWRNSLRPVVTGRS